MEIQHENKTHSLISHYISKFPMHKPTWKGIQLRRNWFTSRESEHSPCNGQEKALQNYKENLINDQKIPHFTFSSFNNLFFLISIQ